jgi:hypothetical protein
VKKISLGILKWYLLVAGALATAFVFMMLAGAFVAWVDDDYRPKARVIKPEDVQYILDWADLRGCQIEQVPHSRTRQYSTDPLRAYAFKVDGLAGMDLTAPDNQSHKWRRGDQLPSNLHEAVKLINSCHYEIPWFPHGEELTAEKYYFYQRHLGFSDERLDRAEIFIASPADGMIYYFDAMYWR